MTKVKKKQSLSPPLRLHDPARALPGGMFVVQTTSIGVVPPRRLALLARVHAFELADEGAHEGFVPV